jgi:hypothetical protein
MKYATSRTMFAASTLALLLLPAAGQAQQSSVYATGLTGPVKLTLTPRGNLLVTERGTAANDGELSIVDRKGVVRPILTGLPSGIETTGVPSGPQAPAVTGCCVILLSIGEGDMLRFSPNGPPAQVPNATGSVSPIFSSVLRLVFSQPIDQVSEPFELARADHDLLADGRTVKLENAAGQNVWIRLVADFKDARPDPVTNVRGSNPFHLIARPNGSLFVIDSGQNSLLRLDSTGWPEVVVRFPPIANAPGVIPPFSDAVPTAVRHYEGSKYLVSLLTGVPFTPGSASLRLVDVVARSETPFIGGLTSVTDVLTIGKRIFVLEISENLSSGAPGRLLRFTDPAKPPVVVASGLIGPSGMVFDPERNAIFIAEIFTGRIIRVDR